MGFRLSSDCCEAILPQGPFIVVLLLLLWGHPRFKICCLIIQITDLLNKVEYIRNIPFTQACIFTGTKETAVKIRGSKNFLCVRVCVCHWVMSVEGPTKICHIFDFILKSFPGKSLDRVC